MRKAILSALCERDETAAVCFDKEGNAEPDPELRDTESVPLAEMVESFFAREVKPHVPDHDANRISVGELWRSISFADLKDHEMKKYLKRIAAKTKGATEVPYNEREKFVSRKTVRQLPTAGVQARF